MLQLRNLFNIVFLGVSWLTSVVEPGDGLETRLDVILAEKLTT